MTSATKPALIVIPSPPILPYVHSLLIPGVQDKFEEIVVGTNDADFEQILNKFDCVAIVCGIVVPDLKSIVSRIISRSPAGKVVWIHSFSAGVDHWITDEVKESKAPVTNAKGCFSHSLAEYTLLGCMYFDKQVQRLQLNKTNKSYERFEMGELLGQTIGIIGYGDIGQAIGRLAAAFGMKILAYKRRDDKVTEGVELRIGEDGLNHVLKNSDFVVSALPGTPHTKHFINAERLAMMKPTAVFINVGRGSCVDEAALVEALRDHRIKGACLDVFEVEPLPTDSPLWTLDNVLLSPHNADMTRSYYQSTVQRFVELANDYFAAGRPFPSLVDLDAGY